jgi:hypothetical protein
LSCRLKASTENSSENYTDKIKKANEPLDGRKYHAPDMEDLMKLHVIFLAPFSSQPHIFDLVRYTALFGMITIWRML